MGYFDAANSAPTFRRKDTSNKCQCEKGFEKSCLFLNINDEYV